MRRGLVCILLCVAAWDVMPAGAQISRLPHSAPPHHFFGSAVALSGDTAIVGAGGEEACGTNAGAAFIFDRDTTSGVWSQSARIACRNCEPNQFFGHRVAISGDVAVVAAGVEYFATEHPNVAHVFERDATGAWKEVAHLRPNVEISGTFASSVDVDGDRILVVASGDHIHGRYTGDAFIFERSDAGDWLQTAHIVPTIGPSRRGDAFGRSGAIHANRVIISAPGRAGAQLGSVYIFEMDTPSGAWLQRARFDGYSDANIAVDIYGDLAVTGDHERGGVGRGTARLYGRDDTGSWKLLQHLVPAVSSQSGGVGTDVAVRTGRALIVGYDEQLDQETNIDRVVFVFEPDSSGTWRQRHVIDIGRTEFGAALDVDSGYAIVGDSGDFTPGAAYVVRVH